MLEDELKKRRKRLEEAINTTLTDSPQIGEIVQELRQDGFDVFLIIEATVGLSKRSGSEEPSESKASVTRLHLTSQDERFLKSLKIKPE